MARPRKKSPLLKGYAPDRQDELIKRISDCEVVLNHLKDCPAWKVIEEDLRLGCLNVDNNWYKLPEGKELQEFRVTKLAYMHLLNLREMYQQDFDSAHAELEKLQGAQENIIKDYDVATPLQEKV